jgi:hypothetical protein
MPLSSRQTLYRGWCFLYFFIGSRIKNVFWKYSQHLLSQLNFRWWLHGFYFLYSHPWILLDTRFDWFLVSWHSVLMGFEFCFMCSECRIILGWWLVSADYWSQFHVSDYVRFTYVRMCLKSIDFYSDLSFSRCNGYVLFCQHVGVMRIIFNVVVVLCAKLIFQSSGVESCFSTLESHSSRRSAKYSLNY